MSVDGYIDDGADARLLLSNEEDFDRVDEVRASVDAILVGAATIRKDNPRLLVRAPHRQAERLERGEPATPMKVTLTRCGELDPSAAFFASGECDKLVYCTDGVHGVTSERLAGVATVMPVESLDSMLADLAARGVRRLMVEGGATVHTQLLAAGLADELHLVIAPFFVGDARAPRFVGDAAFRHTASRRMHLVEVRPIGDCVLLRYAL
jgi:riboflavin-specific deaminase-like protein